MAYTVYNVQQLEDTSSGTNIQLPSYDPNFGTSGRRMLVVAVAQRDSDANAVEAPTVKYGKGTADDHTLTEVVTASYTADAQDHRVGLYVYPGLPTTTRNIDADWPNAKGETRIGAWIVDGIYENGSAEDTDTQTGTSTTDSGTLTTLSELAAVFAAVSVDNSGNITAGSGLTEIVDVGSVNMAMSAGHKSGPASPGSSTYSFSWGSSSEYAMVAFAWPLYIAEGVQDATISSEIEVIASPLVGRSDNPVDINYVFPGVKVGRPTDIIKLGITVRSTFSETYSHADEAESRLPSQFDEKTSIHALARLFGERTDTLRKSIRTVQYFRTLPHAYGKQLDKLGSLLDLSRGGLIDDRYRTALAAQILSISSQTTLPDITDLLAKLWGSSATVTITETAPGKATITVTGIDPDFQALHSQLIQAAKALGVGLTITYS